MGITSENKIIHTPPHPLYSKLECLLFPTGSSNKGTTLHGRGGGGGWGGKLHFPALKLAKRQTGPLGRSVSTNFVTVCCYWLNNASILSHFLAMSKTTAGSLLLKRPEGHNN